MSSLPLLQYGQPKSKKRAIRTIDFMTSNVAASGFFYPMIENGAVSDDSFGVTHMKNCMLTGEKQYDVKELCALVHPITAEVLGTYEKDFYAGMPALTKNTFGDGTAYYIAARTESDFLRDFYGDRIRELGIHTAVDGDLPEGVSAHDRCGEKGRIIFVENYTGEEKNVHFAAEYKLYGTSQMVKSIKLPPYGAAVLSDFTNFENP